jgi:hypothetical protein
VRSAIGPAARTLRARARMHAPDRQAQISGASVTRRVTALRARLLAARPMGQKRAINSSAANDYAADPRELPESAVAPTGPPDGSM